MHLFSVRTTGHRMGDVEAGGDIVTEVDFSFVSLFLALVRLVLMLVVTSRAYQAFLTTCDKIRSSATRLLGRGNRATCKTLDAPVVKSGSIVCKSTVIQKVGGS